MTQHNGINIKTLHHPVFFSSEKYKNSPEVRERE